MKKYIKMMPLHKDEYHFRINVDLADEYVTQTMMDLLNKLLSVTSQKHSNDNDCQHDHEFAYKNINSFACSKQ